MSTQNIFKIDPSKPVHVYFIGIGGVSMSGLAHILKDKNFIISGSDKSASSVTDELKSLGITVHIGQEASNIKESPVPINVVVYTAAVHPDNPEYAEALKENLPLLSRAELLGQIMKYYKTSVAVAGTHGKTTSTSMLSEITMQADADPTLLIGGVYSGIGSNIRIGSSETLITEACEYTNSFLSFFPSIGIILNVESDHLDFFKDLDEIYDSFHRFAKLIPDSGALIINKSIDRFDFICSELSCPCYSFGLSDDCDYYASNISYNSKGNPSFTIIKNKDSSSFEISLTVPGEHNILNALAAFACADIMSIDARDIVRGLNEFKGAGRRFEYKGVLNGVTVIDDYAHHPTEIDATLTAAKRVEHNEIWCLFQPHTYTRTKALLTEFAAALNHADHVLLLPIYAAREKDIYGISSADLRDKINKLGGDCYLISDFENVKDFISKNCTNNDLLITMGAGDVTKIGNMLLKK